MKNWKPTYVFNHYTELTPEWCVKEKVKFILSDLDGTLVGWNEDADESFIAWYKSIEAVGVGLIIVSNNEEKRVQEFAKTCSLVAYSRCHKPSIQKVRKEITDKGLNLNTAIFLGDQLFTDVWCGNKLGVRTALVNPIGYEPYRTKCKRWMERLVKKTWRDE